LEKIFLHILDRYQKWWKNINRVEIQATRFIFHLSGWLVTFYFIISSIELLNLKWMQVWIVFHIFFWYQLNRTIVRHIDPPVGLLLISAIAFSSLQNLFLSSILKTIPAELSLSFFPALILALQVLTFSLIIVIDSSTLRTFDEQADVKKLNNTHRPLKKVKQKSLIFYTLIGYFAYQIVFFEYEYVLLIFQVFLVVTFLNKSKWLEKLSRSELIIYFWLLIVVFYIYRNPTGLETVNFLEVKQKVTWFGLPFYLHLLVKMYLLAVIIKIPIVLIYNHATLSRKMWIAGLFQSTFPQLIQFVFLCFVFFSLISSWQAENIREALDRQIEQIKSGNISPTLTHNKIPLQSGMASIYLTEYLPFNFLDEDKEHGILSLRKTHKRAKRDFNQDDFFLYLKSFEEDQNVIYLIKLDTAFVSLLTKDVSFLAGSGLILYPFAPKEWQKFIFDLSIYEENETTKIYPFGILSLNRSWSILSTRKPDESKQKKEKIFGSEDIFGNQKFILGRLFTPVSNATSENQPYFAFDIYLNLDSIFSPSAVGKAIWGLLLIFFLFNTLVIGQVGKFGSQINKIIVHKFSQLKVGIQQIAKGNLDYKFKMEGEDEFVELAGHFNEMSIKLKHTISEAREKDRLDHELKIARQVQMSLLPSKLPEFERYQLAASIVTANEIGGDFYDIVAIEKNKYLFTIGDVSGKGSSAAFYMAQFISLLRYSAQFTNQPDEIAIRMNRYFSTQIEDRQLFITAIIGILDLTKNHLEFVRAGHMLPFLLPGNKKKAISELQIEGLGLGLTKTQHIFKKKIKLSTVKLQPGDMVVFYTDGVVEAARPPSINDSESEIVVYGDNRFNDLLKQSRDLSVMELMAVCTNDLDTFYAGNPRVDDHTLLFLQRNR
jgi:serine phosphatase RsbU (regulator of sigma subunit)